MSGIMSMVLGAKTAIAAAVDAYFNLVTLLLPGDGTNGAQNNTFLDSSSNNFTITRNGGNPGMTQGTFSPFSQTGWSNYFDGSSYLTISTNPIPTTGNFTLELWVYFNDKASDHIFGNGSSGGFLLQTDGTNIYFGQFGVGTYASSVAYTANTWTHIAVVRNGSSWTLYQNGVSVATATWNPTFTAGTCTIAGGATGGIGAVNGYISNARVTNTVVYSSNFTPSTTALTAITGTQLLTCQSNRFVDNSSNAYTFTLTGTPSVQAFSPFAPTAAYSASTNGGSGYFDGTGDWLALPSSSNLALGSGDFCVETWIYQTTAAAAGIIGNSTSAGDGDTQYELQIGSSPYYPRFIGWTSVFLTSSTAITINQWNHLAVCRSGTTCSMFLNGTRVATGTVSQNFSSTNALNIGRQAAGTAALAGYLSGTRIVKGSSVYSPSSTTITVPTAPLTAVTNTQLLTNFTNAGITDATAKNDLETVGNAQISTTQSKFGGSSMYFDGTGDYLRIPSSAILALGTGAYTIEFWIYPNALAAGSSHVVGANSTNGIIVLVSNAKVALNKYGVGDVLAYNTALTTSTWSHVAVVREGTGTNQTKIYVNGTSVATGTDSNDWTVTSLFGLGANLADGSQALNGYIDDLRITKGYARYTANFTAPTAAFPLS